MAIGIEDWDWGLGFWIGDLRLELEIEIGDLNYALGLSNGIIDDYWGLK